MEYVVYGDVLVAVNFLMDFLILGLCEALSGLRQRRWRRIAASAAGGLWSFAIFLPAGSVLLDAGVRLAVSLTVVFLAYGRQRPRVFLRLVTVFYAASLLVAGAVVALWFLFPGRGYAYGNGAVYLNLSPAALLGAAGAAYLFVRAFDRAFRRCRADGELYPIRAFRGGRTAGFTALADTGNRLAEPFSGRPLVLVSLEKARPLLTPEELAWLESGMEAGEPPPGVRLAPYSTVSGRGLLAVVRPERLEILAEGRWLGVSGALALSPGAVLPRGCDGIFHPGMMELAAPEDRRSGVASVRGRQK